MGATGKRNSILYVLQGLGAIFVAIFLVAYLGGLPSTDVLHNLPEFRIPLTILGAILLVLITALSLWSLQSQNGN
ncbi:MAG: hypothetical protein ACM3WQ_01405 [Chloroflexota bacterium]|jgi:hypothetical protein|nr:hypothetical protein [Candidatus Sulfotelmatobacter sp.]